MFILIGRSTSVARPFVCIVRALNRKKAQKKIWLVSQKRLRGYRRTAALSVMSAFGRHNCVISLLRGVQGSDAVEYCTLSTECVS